MSERTVHPLEYVALLKRRKWWFVGGFTLCVVGGILLALLLPPTYVSSAVIAVQAPAVETDLVGARASLDREERLRALTQQLRSRTVLDRVAREEGLVAERPIEDVTQDLFQRINVVPTKPLAHTEAELNSFEVEYRDRSAERAHRVTNRLVQVFVEEHSRSRESQAEGTAEFLAAQLRASQERIANLETRLRSAKELHMGKLPEQTQANLSTLSGIRQQLESTSNSLRSEQDRLTLLDREMQNMKQGAYSAPLGSPAAATSPQQRIAILQRELAIARAKYKDKHPELQYLEDELKAARAEAASVGQQSENSRMEVLAGDPAYQQLVAERNQTLLRVRALQRAEAQLSGDITRYQQRVEAAPMVEQELASLTREHEFEKENFKQLSGRHAAALEREQIARSRGGERFSVLHGAYLPDSPESPNRLRILLVALALGTALGGGLAFGREYLDRSIRDARLLQEEFEIPVLAEIPRIRDAA